MEIKMTTGMSLFLVAAFMAVILSTGCNSTDTTGATSAFGIPVSTTGSVSSTSGDGTTAPSGCHGKSCKNGGATSNVQIMAGAQISAEGIHLSPGHYDSAISISNGTDVILDPGIYVLDDGISVSGGSTLTGNGATLSIVGGTVEVAVDSSISGISIVQN